MRKVKYKWQFWLVLSRKYIIFSQERRATRWSKCCCFFSMLRYQSTHIILYLPRCLLQLGQVCSTSWKSGIQNGMQQHSHVKPTINLERFNAIHYFKSSCFIFQFIKIIDNQFLISSTKWLTRNKTLFQKLPKLES